MAISPSVFRSAVTSMRAAAADLLVDVDHEAFSGQSGAGVPTYAAAVTRGALVEQKTKAIRKADGSETAATMRLTFPEPFAVGARDRFTVSGTAYPVQSMDTVLDPGTGQPYFVIVWI